MRRPGRAVVGWVALAVAGLVLAAGAAYAASHLASQPIGLSSEPITAGRDLAPTAQRTSRPRSRPTATPTASPTATVTPAPGVDDHGGGSGGNSGSGGGDDSSGGRDGDHDD